MSCVKTSAIDYAHNIGIDDIKFVGPNVPVCETASKTYSDIYNKVTCTVVLFKAYCPSKPAPLGMMPVSPYYVASHFSYSATKNFVAYLTNRGYFAQLATALDAKAAALVSGGFIGDNGFYYHPDLGSLICIQTVLTNAFSPDPPIKDGSLCMHCGACMNACPSKGVNNLQNCLRSYSDSFIPELFRHDVYQLIGCEKCQTVCPLNGKTKKAPYAFSINSLLEASCTDKLSYLIGKNMARKRKVVSQAALYAARTNYRDALKNLHALSQSACEPIKTHADWAYNELNGN